MQPLTVLYSLGIQLQQIPSCSMSYPKVFSTQSHYSHYYNRLITLPTLQLLYQPAIHHMASINVLRLPLKKFFCLQDWCLTHTVQLHTTSAIQSSIATTSISLPKLIFTSIVCIKSHGTHLQQQYCSHHQFSSSIMEQPSEKLQQPLLPVPPLITLIRH
jgi:hypothetical protein